MYVRPKAGEVDNAPPGARLNWKFHWSAECPEPPSGSGGFQHFIPSVPPEVDRSGSEALREEAHYAQCRSCFHHPSRHWARANTLAPVSGHTPHAQLRAPGSQRAFSSFIRKRFNSCFSLPSSVCADLRCFASRWMRSCVRSSALAN